MRLLRDVNYKQDLIINKQETIMTKQAEAAAAMDALEATMQEQNAGILKEIEQLKAAGSGGSGDGMSVEEVDAMIARLSTLKGVAQAGVDALKGDD
jgi:cbb3-type cytochrome oxidase cytochrome c subunit